MPSVIRSQAPTYANIHSVTAAQSGLDRGELIRLRKAKRWSMKRLADTAGVDYSAYWRIEKGRARNPRYETVQRLADALAVKPETLYAPTPLPPLPLPSRRRQATPRDVVPVPRLDMRIGAGAATGDAGYEMYRLIDETERDHRRVLVTVYGACMSPRIEPGDDVIVDQDRPWKLGDLVAIDHEGDLLVKRVAGVAGDPYLVADDQTVIHPDAQTRVLGVIVKILKNP